MVTLKLGSVSVPLKEAFDFSFLAEYGEVFKAFDQNDSGNISFGVVQGGKRFFLKVAGPRTINGSVAPEEAVKNLQQAAVAFEFLAHPYLTKLLEHREIPGGYLLVFEWREGECLQPHWEYDEIPPSDPRSPVYRFFQLSLEHRLQSFETVLEFHMDVAKKGWGAVDFYDGTILYDFAAKRTSFCDIDLYRPFPFVNNMGRMWGSTRFMAPEEFVKGAVIDERTTVFTMGATAFWMFGGCLDRDRALWNAGEKRYEVASRAVEEDPQKRFETLADFYAAWNAAG